MGFGEIKINTKEVESKLKILHKHLGNMLEDFEKVCTNCGSTDTDIEKIRSDDERVKGIKICRACEECEYL